MNFYNIFTNISDKNPNASQYLNLIEKLLIETTSENTTEYFSEGFAEAYDTWNRNQRTHDNRFTVVKNLNPSLFASNSPTLPYINALENLNSGNSHGRYISNYRAFDAYINEYLTANGSPRNSYTNSISDDCRAKTRMTKNDYLSYNNLSFSRNRPNTTLATYFQTILNSIEHSQNLNINLDSHQALLEDGHACIAEIPNVTKTMSSFASKSNLSSSIETLIGVVQIAKILKSTDSDPSVPPLHHNYSIDVTSYPSLFQYYFPDSISKAAVKAWNETRTTDTYTSFSHIDFFRLTDNLLSLQQTELTSIINGLQNITINNYIKYNEIGTYNERKIFSSFSAEFLNKILHMKNHPNSLSTSLTSPSFENLLILDELEPIKFQPLHAAQANSNWDFQRTFVNRSVNYMPPNDSSKPFMPIGHGFGVTFLNYSGARNITNDKSYNIIKNKISSLNQRILGLILNGFVKSSSKQKFEFLSLTKNQSLTRKGFFIPTLFPILYRDENFEIQQGYSFSLLNMTSTYDEVINKKRSRKELFDLIKNYLDSDGLYFTNFQEFQKKVQSKIKALSEYGSFSTTSIDNFHDTQINQLQESLLRCKNHVEDLCSKIDVNFFDNLSAEPNVNKVIKRKYQKVSSHYQRLLDSNALNKSNITNSSNSIISNIRNIKTKTKYIQDLLDELKIYEASLSSDYQNIKNQFNKRVDVVLTLIKNKNIHHNISKRYFKAYQEAIENGEFESNKFFFNMLQSNSIHITEVTLQDKKTGDSLKFNKDFFSKEDLFKFLSSFKKELYDINNVNFIINSPVLINVDGGQKGQVCGGPYAIKVTRSTLRIALLYPSSIHGSNNDQIWVHPHAGNINTSNFVDSFRSSQSLRYMNACLGEASSLIWKSFEQNDLKAIILSSLTWVKSANSTDAWGRNYKYFPTSAQIQASIKSKAELKEESAAEQDSITEDEVQEFIETMVEETENTSPQNEISEDFPPNLNTINNTTEVTDTNVTASENITDFNTDQPYIPYALSR